MSKSRLFPAGVSDRFQQNGGTLHTACLESEGYSQCVVKVITTSFHTILQDVLLAVDVRQILVHLGTLETEVGKLDVGTEFYINM